MSTANLKSRRDPMETRQNILELAFMEVYKHGFKGTSTNDIIDKMKLTRGAFFHHFPTKEDLGYALIDEVLMRMIVDRWIKPVEAYENPVQGIVKNFSTIVEEHLDENLLCGCPLNNLAQEMSDRPNFQKRIQKLMELWVKETQVLLSKAKKSGYLKKEADTRHLAEFIVACQESSFAMGKAMNSHAVMRTIVKSLKSHLEVWQK